MQRPRRKAPLRLQYHSLQVRDTFTSILIEEATRPAASRGSWRCSGMPKQGAAWSSLLKVVTTWYTGNDQATQQVLGPRDPPSKRAERGASLDDALQPLARHRGRPSRADVQRRRPARAQGRDGGHPTRRRPLEGHVAGDLTGHGPRQPGARGAHHEHHLQVRPHHRHQLGARLRVGGARQLHPARRQHARRRRRQHAGRARLDAHQLHEQPRAKSRHYEQGHAPAHGDELQPR